MPENPQSFAPRIAVRHVQFVRAVLAAIAAAMITFSADHSAGFGLAVFSGFAITTALVLLFAGWMAYSQGRRWPAFTLAIVTAVAGMVSGVPVWRTTLLFFVVIIAWGVVAGAIETIAGWRERAAMRRDGTLDPQRRSEARDAIVVGVLGLVLALAVGLVPAGFHLDYVIRDGGQDHWFTLTGIAIGVGIFGAYAAVVAVFLGIAAFSPRRAAPPAAEQIAEGDPDAAPAPTGETA